MVRRVLELYAQLIDYPKELIVEDIQSLQQNLRRLGNALPALEQLELFQKSVEQLSLAALQELYTPTFDLSPVCSPHAGFHLFGESYKRGSLMAKLREEYQHFGLQESSEIPDHLSPLLRYCAVLSTIREEHEVFKELLALILVPAVDKMVASFAEAANPYNYLVGSLSAWLNEIGVFPHV